MLILNGEKVNVTIFPDKTSQVWAVDKISPGINLITFVWEENEAEIFHLVQLANLIDSCHPDCYKSLNIPYLPYARQDKPVNNDSTFSLSSFASILNMLHFNSVTAFDVHSKKAGKLIKNFQSIPANDFHNHVFSKFNQDLDFYPDGGAAVRYSKGFTHVPLFGQKVRNPQTGKIEGYKVINNSFEGLEGKRILIIDDLCDGGATFITAAKELKKLGVEEIGLCVSHGVFSKGFEEMKQAGISQFFTTNSLPKNKKGYKIYE